MRASTTLLFIRDECISICSFNNLDVVECSIEQDMRIQPQNIHSTHLWSQCSFIQYA